MFLPFLGPPTHLFDDLQYCKSSKIATHLFDDVILEWSLSKNDDEDHYFLKYFGFSIPIFMLLFFHKITNIY